VKKTKKNKLRKNKGYNSNSSPRIRKLLIFGLISSKFVILTIQGDFFFLKFRSHARKLQKTKDKLIQGLLNQCNKDRQIVTI
jgi:hypothetical protein